MNHLTTIALLAWIGFCSASVTAATASPPAAVQTLSAYRGTASWDIRDRWYFVVKHSCNTDGGIYEFWPADPICSGRLETYRRYLPSGNLDSSNSDDALSVRLGQMSVDSENKIRELRGASEDISVNGKWGTPSQMYDSIVALQDPVASFKENSYRLSEFKELVEEDLRASLENAAVKVRKKRSEDRTTILVGIALSLCALVALWFIYRLGKRFLPSLAESGAKKSKGALGELRNMHVRHVAMDETIRATTRASLDITQKERTELRAQISQAIDAGNPELAKTLMSLLQKLEGDTASI